MPRSRTAPPAAALAAPWEPLELPLFRALWLATMASNIGTWVHEVGAAWLMTTLTTSPPMVAAVQAATSLPMFLLALPAGALADLVDRRKLLIATQTWMLCSAAGLGALTLLDRVTPWTLLLFTFAMGLGSALNSPSWQASVSELVGPERLPAAVALNSVGFNVARALGPALGGLLIATIGPGANFVLNAFSFLGVLVVLLRWRQRTDDDDLPSERLLGALRTGARYVRHAPALHAVFVRGALFVLFGSALWALLPIVARFQLHAGPGGYGALLGAFGSGAVAGAAGMHRLRRRFGFDGLAAIATLVMSTVLVLLALRLPLPALCVALFAGGGAWLTVLSGFNIAAQTSVPGWVRGRALSVYLLVFYGSIAAGSALWGVVADRFGTSVALAIAAGGLLIGLLATLRFPLLLGEGTSLAPSRHWPAPLVTTEPEPDRGPVLVTLEYYIDPQRAPEFVRLLHRLGHSRQRGGAVRWGLWQDTEDAARWTESFVDESWLEHLRHHERLTVADRELEAAARAFHVGPAPPRLQRYLAGTRAAFPRRPGSGDDTFAG
jgi:predicted MFS family arabinose efflux permease